MSAFCVWIPAKCVSLWCPDAFGVCLQQAELTFSAGDNTLVLVLPFQALLTTCHHFNSLHVCVSLCVCAVCGHTCMYGCPCTCENCMDVEVPGYCYVSSWLPSHLIYWGRVSELHPELTDSGNLDIQLLWASWCLCFPTAMPVVHLCGYSRSKLRSLCVHGKHLTRSTVPQPPFRTILYLFLVPGMLCRCLEISDAAGILEQGLWSQ